MPATPYALAQVSISGGGVVTGAQSVASAASLQLSPQSTVGWTTAPLWEIYDYPPGFATPAGWTLQASGIITSTAQTPPIINLPANTGVLFGKYAFRLTSNNNNDPNNPNQVDTTLIVKMKSVHNINTVAYGEGSQFGGAQRQWLLDLNADLRAIESALGGTNTTNFGTDDPVLSFKQPRFVTTDATPVDCSVAQWTMPDLTMADVIVKVMGKQAASALFFAGDFRIRVTRNGGAPVFGALIPGSTQVALGAAAVTITNPSGNIVSPHVVGVVATNITWSVVMTVQPVTSAT